MSTQPDVPTQFDLAPQHLAMLRTGSGIADAVIAARGYRTITTKAELARLGFTERQRNVPGLLLPVHTPGGDQPWHVYRPDFGRVEDDHQKGRLPDGTYPCKVIKYETPKGAAMRVDCPPSCRERMGDPATPLWITEGQKKADALASHGLCAIALLGVWNFKGRNSFGGSTVLADFDFIAWKHRDVRIVYDSDVMTKAPVQAALRRLTEILQFKGAHVVAVYLPPMEGGEKQGVDDYLAHGHSVADLERLVQGPRAAPQPAPQRVELLDVPPDVMRQPIALIRERGYAAFWATVRVETAEAVGRNGEIVRYDPPQVTTPRWLFVMRDDGRIFNENGAGVSGKFADPPFTVKLPEEPRADRTWSPAGVKAYVAGNRPAAEEVFKKIVANVDRFIDFEQSLADQRTMCELVACYVMATYFQPAFNVMGYFWPTGDRGSGKTQLLNVVCKMAYLGHVLLASGSFSALRDLAEYGATLAFDDAENVSDPQKMDPDKRALLLAGNRRGAEVPFKEADGERGWRLRWMSTFCPRLFSAIRLPDPVLASRTIVVPLVRSPDRSRTNADVEEDVLWRYGREQLVDDLWAVALANQVEMLGYEFMVNDRAALQGRALEPWRAILAVALWLEEIAGPGAAAAGLFDRMNRLSVAYQSDRWTLEPCDAKIVVLRVLEQMFEEETGDAGSLKLSASRVAELACALVDCEELDIAHDRLTATRVGRIMAQMRLEPMRDVQGKRHWLVPREQLARALEAYGLGGPADHAAMEGAERDGTAVQTTENPKIGNGVFESAAKSVGSVGSVGPAGMAGRSEGASVAGEFDGEPCADLFGGWPSEPEPEDACAPLNHYDMGG